MRNCLVLWRCDLILIDYLVALPKKHHSNHIVLSWFMNYVAFTTCPRIAPDGTDGYELHIFIVVLLGPLGSEIVTKVAISQWLLNALSVMNWKAHVTPWGENTISFSLIMIPDNDGAIQKYHSMGSELCELLWYKTNLDGSDIGSFFFAERHIGLSVLFLEGLITATWGNKSAPAPLEKKPLGSQLNPCWQKSVASQSFTELCQVEYTRF